MAPETIHRTLLALFLLVSIAACSARQPPRPPVPLPGAHTEWQGYDRYDFIVDGRACIVVAPLHEAPGRPWIWRARFFGQRPEVDLALLSRGFHLAYMDVAGLYGSPTAVAHWTAFYDYLTTQHGFADKPALEGISRGALIVYNWAAANPDKVACIYVDIPVCDFKSWPAGLGRGSGSPEDWRLCLAAYGLTTQAARMVAYNPIDNLAPLAAAGVPLLHAYGDADTVVPPEENTAIVVERYRALGGDITVIVKHGAGHDAGLDDPAPVIDFILRQTRVAADR